MKKDLSTQLTDYEGKPLYRPKSIPLNEWVKEMQDALDTLNMEGMRSLLIKMETLKETPILTIADVLIDALKIPQKDDVKLNGDGLLQLDKLVRRIAFNNGEPVELDIEKEVPLLLERLRGSTWRTPLVYGQVHRFFNDNINEPEKQ